MPTDLPLVTSGYFAELLVMYIIVMSLIIPAVFVRDKMLGIQKGQWGSRHGRQTVWSQFWATMLGSFLIITLLLAIFGGLFLNTEFGTYFNSRLNSFLAESAEAVSFYNWTFDQWILVLISMIYLIGLGYSGILFFHNQADTICL